MRKKTKQNPVNSNPSAEQAVQADDHADPSWPSVDGGCHQQYAGADPTDALRALVGDQPTRYAGCRK